MPAAIINPANPTQNTSSRLLQKRIPTFIGLGFLVIALIIGVIFMGKGGGVFAPRASAETTPKNIRLTNVTDTTFTISFLTDNPTGGFVKYGTAANKITQQASDDRDQLSGTEGEFTLHHVTVRNLQPGANYFYVIGTESNSLFDNNGAPFSISTGKRAGAPSAAKTIYGSVTTESNVPAVGSVVYLKIDGVGDMSALVTNTGGWAVPLSNARTPDGAGYATITDETQITVTVQGTKASQTAQGVVPVKDSQPVPTIAFGRGFVEVAEVANKPTPTPEPTEEPQQPTPPVTPKATPQASGSAALAASASARLVASGSASLTATENASSTAALHAVTMVDMDSSLKPTVTTVQPTIVGKAAPNVKVKIEVHSDTQITQEVTADPQGQFELDIAQLSETLEPGEHTVTITYTDPETNQEVTLTRTFTVAPKSSNLVALATTPTPTPTATPFGTTNPYPIGGATTSATTTATPTPTATPKISSTSSSLSGSSGATRSSHPSTASGVPVSGAIGTTLALIFGGLFFIIAGSWSFWISSQFAKEDSRL